jgi:hypothetical protein
VVERFARFEFDMRALKMRFALDFALRNAL